MLHAHLNYQAAVSLAFSQLTVHQDKPRSPYMPLLRAIIEVAQGHIHAYKQQTHTQSQAIMLSLSTQQYSSIQWPENLTTVSVVDILASSTFVFMCPGHLISKSYKLIKVN